MFEGSWRKSNQEAGSKNESEKRRDKRDTLKTHKRGIESKEKKFEEYELRSKEMANLQQTSSYNKQKLESEEESKLKFCIVGKEKDGQNFSKIPNQRKVSRIPVNEEGKYQ